MPFLKWGLNTFNPKYQYDICDENKNYACVFDIFGGDICMWSTIICYNDLMRECDEMKQIIKYHC